MKGMALLFVLALLIAGCDGYRDFAGPDPDEDPQSAPPDAGPAAGTFTVSYLVEGTYYTCEISYTNSSRTTVATPRAVRLPWALSFQIDVDAASGPFDASVSATCADPTRLGKSTVTLLVDQQVKARSSAVGFGATARAAHAVGIR